MSIKLIAIDMDGTLLNEQRLISPANQEAIRKAVAKGVVVTIATGRMFRSVQHYARELGLNVPLIVYNGALVQEAVSEKIMGAWPLRMETAKKILSFCRQHECYVQAYVNDTLWVYEDCEFARAYAQFAGVDFDVHGESLYELPEDPHKLLMISPAGRCEELRTLLQKNFGQEAHITNSLGDFLEIIAPQTSKWQAIMCLAERCDIKSEEIMCIGDSNNDMEMIANAGIGVAMGNANEAVKKAAKIITATNVQDGVAMVINSVLTQQLPEEDGR